MGNLKKSNKWKKSNQAKWLYPFVRAKKNFQKVKDKHLGEGLVNLTVGLIALNSKRPYRQRFHNGRQTWPWPWHQLPRTVQRRLE